MSDDPIKIAEYLVEEHGYERALKTAQEGAAAAQDAGDNYELSVWREVKRVLRER